MPFSWELFIKTLLVFFLLPLVMAVASKRVLPAEVNSLVSRAQTLFLSLAVASILASQESACQSILEVSPVLSSIIAYFAAVFLLGRMVGRIFSLERGEAVLLSFTTSARNSPVALAIAAGAFPGMPLTLALLAVAPVIEIPVLAMAARFLSVKR